MGIAFRIPIITIPGSAHMEVDEHKGFDKVDPACNINLEYNKEDSQNAQKGKLQYVVN
jgi:hypothetical protein